MTTAFGVLAATWAMLMALSPLLQVREIQRRRSSEGISIGYFCVLLVGFALWVASASPAATCRLWCRTPSPCS
ncbi:MAG: SemiSWEET family transporter [Solirubrobacteraceae bacterium]